VCISSGNAHDPHGFKRHDLLRDHRSAAPSQLTVLVAAPCVQLALLYKIIRRLHHFHYEKGSKIFFLPLQPTVWCDPAAMHTSCLLVRSCASIGVKQLESLPIPSCPSTVQLSFRRINRSHLHHCRRNKRSVVDDCVGHCHSFVLPFLGRNL
jgi:hypothetical protein